MPVSVRPGTRLTSRRLQRLLLIVGLALTVTGCATLGGGPNPGSGARTHPAMAERARTIHAPGIVPPDIKVYSLSAGGVEDLRDDWSAMGRENVVAAVKANLTGRSVVITPLPGDKETQEAIDDVQKLYAVVSESILDHTYGYGPDLFWHKLKGFEYSVGPVDRLLAKVRADALVLVHGADEISSGGRKALQVVGTIIPFAPKPRQGFTGMTIALVDRSGTILWYEAYGRSGGADFRDRESVAAFVKRIMDDFPRLGR